MKQFSYIAWNATRSKTKGDKGYHSSFSEVSSADNEPHHAVRECQAATKAVLKAHSPGSAAASASNPTSLWYNKTLP